MLATVGLDVRDFVNSTTHHSFQWFQVRVRNNIISWASMDSVDRHHHGLEVMAEDGVPWGVHMYCLFRPLFGLRWR